MNEYKIRLGYGKDSMGAEGPADWEYVRLAPEPFDPISDLARAVQRKIENPDTGPALKKIVEDKNNIAIIVPDMTRKLDLPAILDPVIQVLNRAGIDDSNVKILIGAGAHRPLLRDEMRDWIGPAIFHSFSVSNHDCDNFELMTHLGSTGFGTPVELNRIAAEADLRILIGAVTFHYFAGFSGGRKAIMPGCASRRSITRNHALTLDSRGMKNPNVKTAALDGNPVHEDMLEAARMTGESFVINIIPGVTGDAVNLVAGEMNSAHRLGCNWFKDHGSVTLDAPLQGAIVSCGGYPKDVNFIQAHKALDHIFDAVMPGGVIILLARCSEGLGSVGITQWIGRGSASMILQAIGREYSIPGHTVYCAKFKAERRRIILVSGLADAEVKSLGMEPAADLRQAVGMAVRLLPPDARVGVAPRGGDTLALCPTVP